MIRRVLVKGPVEEIQCERKASEILCVLSWRVLSWRTFSRCVSVSSPTNLLLSALFVSTYKFVSRDLVDCDTAGMVGYIEGAISRLPALSRNDFLSTFKSSVLNKTPAHLGCKYKLVQENGFCLKVRVGSTLDSFRKRETRATLRVQNDW